MSTSNGSPPEPTGRPQARWLSLTVLLVPAAMTLLSVTSVNVALPAIRTDLQTTAVEQALVLTLYALVFALVLLPAGRWGDRYGHTKVFVAGVSIFTAASLWSGFAPDALQLVLSRGLTGVGASLLMTPVTSLIQLLYTGAERARPFGIMGAVFGASSAIGPILGGILIEIGGEIGWRLVFLVNVPFSVLALVFTVFALPRSRPRGVRGNDPIGMLLFTLGITATMLPFSMGTGFDAVTTAIFITGIILLALFVWWEQRRVRRGAFALVPMRLFRLPALPIGVLTTFLGFAGFTSSFLFLALLWQDALGHGALEAGLIVLPFALGTTLSSAVTDPLTRRFGTSLVTAGLSLIAAGLATVGLLVLVLPPESITFWVMLLPLFVAGIGVGWFVGPNTNASFEQIEAEHAGIASAMVMVAQRCGTAVGIGMVSMLFAVFPGGSSNLMAQVIASVATAAFAASAAIVLVVTRRSKLDLRPAAG